MGIKAILILTENNFNSTGSKLAKCAKANPVLLKNEVFFCLAKPNNDRRPNFLTN